MGRLVRMGEWLSRGARLAGVVVITLAWLVGGLAGDAEAQSLKVCFKSNTELDFLTKADMQNSRAKLINPAYFGAAGTAAPEALTFGGLASVTGATLASNGCDIFIGGGFEGSLTAAEGAALNAWVSAGNRFVIGGCDLVTNPVCTSLGRTLTNIPNGGITVNSALSYNPIMCGGVQNIATFGGASTIVGTVPSDSILATHIPAGQAAVTTDNLVTPKFLMTGDADMFGSSGSGAIGAGATATTDQAVFLVSVFKFAADAIKGRLVNPQCFASYNQLADLEIASVTSNATPSVGGQTTITVTVSNQGPNAVTDVTAKIPLPAGLTLASQAGNGTYVAGTGVWTIGAIGVANSATITLTLDVGAAGPFNINTEISNTSLADPDSSTNTGFGVDDKADGIADDDEASIAITPVSSVDVSLAQTVSDATPATGDTITYTLTATNHGPTNVTGVSVRDSLPAGLLYVSDNGAGAYDPGSGIWSVGAIANGANAQLQITARVEATGDLANRAEITASDLPDPDSDPSLSFDVDDKADALPDDDEVELTVIRTDLTVSGRVFEDNGGAGGLAHNGALDGGEVGLGGVTVRAIAVAGGTVLGEATTAGDGSYRLVLPAAAAGQPVRLETTPAGAGFLAISENPGGLPGLANPSPSDGQVVFTPVAATSYAGVGFGQVLGPTLEARRSVSVQPGGTALLTHVYESHTAGTLAVSIADQTQNPADGFAAPTVFRDNDCSSSIDAGEGVLQNPVPVVAGDMVCVVLRVESKAGTPLGADIEFDIVADTTFTASAIASTLTNHDRVDVGDGAKVEITKRVRNLTTGGAFVVTNQANPGQVLEYRLVFTNPSNGPAVDVTIFDRTPPYTSLQGSLPAITATPAGTACAIVTPPGGGAGGYRGDLQWACTGAMAPGSAGEVRFQVQVDP